MPHKMPKYKLTYFNIRAVAEPMRLLFVVAGVPFEDERFGVDHWDEISKTRRIEFGELPVLTVDGQEIKQAATVARYLGKVFGLVPSDALLAARCDEIVDNVQTLRFRFHAVFHQPDITRKIEVSDAIIRNEVPKFFNILSDLVAKSKNGPYICGNKLSWADVYLAHWIDLMEEKELVSDVKTRYPILDNHRITVFEIPSIKQYIATRPKTAL